MFSLFFEPGNLFGYRRGVVALVQLPSTVSAQFSSLKAFQIIELLVRVLRLSLQFFQLAAQLAGKLRVLRGTRGPTRLFCSGSGIGAARRKIVIGPDSLGFLVGRVRRCVRRLLSRKQGRASHQQASGKSHTERKTRQPHAPHGIEDQSHTPLSRLNPSAPRKFPSVSMIGDRFRFHFVKARQFRLNLRNCFGRRADALIGAVESLFVH
jgi:hypothetical protein